MFLDIFKRAKTDAKEPAPIEEEVLPVNECRHLNATFLGSERVGYGTCLDCGERLSGDLILRNLIDRVEAALQKLDRKSSED